MLEHFLEKQIYRQVYICEQLYDLQEINVHDICSVLSVSYATINNDLYNIKENLSDYIESFRKKKNKCSVIFKDGVSIVDIIQIIYSESFFLKALGHFFDGNFTGIELSEMDFISLSKAYDLKKTIMDFFSYYKYVDENNHIHIPELDYRYMMLMLIELTDWNGCYSHNTNVLNFTKDLIEYVEKHFFNRKYTNIDRYLIYRGITIGFLRHEKFPIIFSNEDIKFIKHHPLFKLIVQGINNVYDINKFSENEILYIFTLFNCKDYISENVELLLKDCNIEYHDIVLKNQSMYDLKKILEKEFGNELFNSITFRKIFINFSRTLLGNIQKFIITPIYRLTGTQQTIKKRLTKCLNIWQVNNPNIFFNPNMINALAIGVDLEKSNTITDCYKQ